jgi:hypothetical protein
MNRVSGAQPPRGSVYTHGRFHPHRVAVFRNAIDVVFGGGSNGFVGFLLVWKS